MAARRELQIVNKLGLHARAAARFVQTASEFESEITLAHNGKQVSGKSIMGVMMLAAGKGSIVEVTAEGRDEQAAVKQLAQLVQDRFGESE